MKYYIINRLNIAILSCLFFILPWVMSGDLFFRQLFSEQSFDIIKTLLFIVVLLLVLLNLSLHKIRRYYIVFILLIYNLLLNWYLDLDFLRIIVNIIPFLLLTVNFNSIMFRNISKVKILALYTNLFYLLFVFFFLIYSDKIITHDGVYSFKFIELNRHQSAYILFTLLLFFLTPNIKPTYRMLGICISVFIIYNYNVRSLIFSLFFLGVYFVHRLLVGKRFNIVIIRIFSYLGIFLFLLYLYFSFDLIIFNELTSGRILNYFQRMDLLASLDFKSLLFGRGFGADMIIVDQWKWEAKASHSDYLTYIFDGGIISFLLISIIHYKMWFDTTLNIKYLVLAIFTSSVINVGLLLKPILLLYVFLLIPFFNSINKKDE
jgi:hypothetical protein